MFFNLIIEINELRIKKKVIKQKRISNIYLKVTIEKNGRSQGFNILSLKDLLPGKFWGAPTHKDIIEF